MIQADINSTLSAVVVGPLLYPPEGGAVVLDLGTKPKSLELRLAAEECVPALLQSPASWA